MSVDVVRMRRSIARTGPRSTMPSEPLARPRRPEAPRRRHRLPDTLNSSIPRRPGSSEPPGPGTAAVRLAACRPPRRFGPPRPLRRPVVHRLPGRRGVSVRKDRRPMPVPSTLRRTFLRAEPRCPKRPSLASATAVAAPRSGGRSGCPTPPGSVSIPDGRSGVAPLGGRRAATPTSLRLPVPVGPPPR